LEKIQYVISLLQYGYGSGIHKYFYKTSKSNLLFIREKMPIEIYNILKDMVDTIEIKFSYETGIIIQPNYEIIVQDGAMKDINCIYLDKVAEKLSEDTASIYKISFKSMVMALDNGISIEDIIDYFKEACKNEMPENVLMSLKEWNEKSKKIKIRKVTIVETDDKYLLEELKSYKDIKKDISMELPYVFEINSKDANKIKRNIEKKNHFCIIE